MNVGLSSLYDIGSNYTIKLNEKELLIFEKEEELKSPHAKKIEELEEKKTKEIEKTTSSKELTQGEELLVNDLQARDAEVRAHEAAHQAAGGSMTGAATYTYQQGPDGKMYAIGGEVSISMKSGSSPQETIANARQVAAAAMAAGNPSSQDFAVASSARVMEMKAQQQLSQEKQKETLGQDAYTNQQNPQQDNKTSLEPFDISV